MGGFLWNGWIMNNLNEFQRFGLWILEWITAEEAKRLANDGDPILEPVFRHHCLVFLSSSFLSSLFLSSSMYIKLIIIIIYQGVSLQDPAGEAGKSDLDHRTPRPRYILTPLRIV